MVVSDPPPPFGVLVGVGVGVGVEVGAVPATAGKLEVVDIELGHAIARLLGYLKADNPARYLRIPLTQVV